MENKEKKEYSSIITTGILVIVALFVGYWIINFVSTTPAPSSSNIAEVKIDDNSYKKINESRDYGMEVKTEEAGYGRTNPFAPYK